MRYQNFTIAEISKSRLSFGFSENGVPFAILPNQKLRFLFPVKIEPVDSAADSIEIKFPDISGKIFPGSMEIIPEHNGTFTLINLVPLETYLRGVVPNELVNNLLPDELQACMAQAIAARNFAFYKMTNQDTSNFDVYSDTRDQVYSGMEKYKTLADSAIALTSGMIVEYDGQPARCFFHSACGGHTENVQHVWQGQPALPYLMGVSDIDSATGLAFCAAAPHFYCMTTYTASQLDRMAQTNLAVANPTYATKRIDHDLADIEIMDRFDSSRIDSLKLTTRDSSIYFVRGDRIRYFFKNIDGTILRSGLFKIDISRNDDGDIKKIILKGKGTGHGVGMCQWGALGMSRLGYSYLQILSHYYPGTEVKKVY
ncbi:MAG: SpoIID/LytB domain-containing protein [Candidatus Kryptoniota bacterium]